MGKRLLEWPSYKKIEECWPIDVPCSDYKIRKTKAALRELKPNFLKFKNKLALRAFILENIYEFKPSTEEFPCEEINKVDGWARSFFSNSNSIKPNCLGKPYTAQQCGGGWRNIRKFIRDYDEI